MCNMAAMFRNYLKIVFLIFLLTSVKCRKQRPSEDPPEISLLSWVGADIYGVSASDYLKTQVAHDIDMDAPVTLVNDTTYILTSEVTIVAFICKASYPIEWEFSNAKWLLLQDKTFGVYLTTSRRTAEDINDPRSFTYWTEVALLGDSRMYNGMYFCKSTDNEMTRSNITVFWEGGPFDNILPLAGKNVTVFVDTSEHNDIVIFPCHVNNPFAQVSLKRENLIPPDTSQNQTNQTQTDDWLPVDLSSFTYRPDTGFIYESKRPNDYPDTSFLYKCSINDENENDQVYMTFVPEHEPSIELDQPIHSNATLIAKNKAYECCSSSATPPKLMVHSCGDPMSCKELIPALKTQQSAILSTSQMTSSVNRITFSQLSGLLFSKNGSCSTYKNYYSQFDLDLVQCIGDGITAMRKFFLRNPLNISYDDTRDETLQKWLTISPQNNLGKDYNPTLVPNKTDIYKVYSGTNVLFDCQASFYFFSHGIRFSTKSTDGSQKIYPDTYEEDLRKRYHIGVMLLLHNPPLRATVNVTITPQTTSLTCHVPVTNSATWIIKTIQFSVKEPEQPSIVTQDADDAHLTETINWTVNDTNKVLTCETKGDPEPRVIWTKDDMPAESKFNVSRHGTTYILKVPVVTHDIHGEFKCIAMNFAGKSEKAFSIIVEDIPGSHAAVIAIATILILAMVVGIVFLVRKAFLQKKSLENLREHIYPEEEGNRN